MHFLYKMEVFVDQPIPQFGGLKRQRPEFNIGRCDSKSPLNLLAHPAENGGERERKRKRNAVQDVLARQQVLSSLVRAQNTDKKGENPVDRAFYEHVTACNKGGECREDNCGLGRKCLQHFERCRKQDCILCVEARLIQTIDREGMKSEDERFRMSAWRARLQSVNDETREFVPYFNSCAQELTVARATSSPFLQSAKDRFLAAHALVSQSEKRYAELCGEIYRRWIVTEEKDNNSDNGTMNSGNDLMFELLHDSPPRDKTPTPLSPLPMLAEEDSEEPKPLAWHNLESDKKSRQLVVDRIFQWSKANTQSKGLLDDDTLLDTARKAEALLYSKARSKQEYEEEAALMSRLCDGTV